MSAFQRTFAFLRTVHIYLTLASFVLLLFFAVTGILLVHSEALGLDAVQHATKSGTIAPDALARSDRLTIVEAVRKLGAFGQVEAYDAGEAEIRVSFARPAGRAEATIARDTGAVTISSEVHGIWAVLGDLHKGKQSGAFWIVIDLAGVLWSLAALTGIVMWWQLKKRRFAGVAWLGVGTLGSVLVAWWLTPW